MLSRIAAGPVALALSNLHLFPFLLWLQKLALQKALDAINAEYGKGTIQRLGDNEQAKVHALRMGR